MAVKLYGITGWGIVATLALALAGCGSAASTSSPQQQNVVAPSPVAPTDPQTVQAVKDGADTYRKMLDAFVAASNAGVADSPELAKYASGRALLMLQGFLNNYRSSGLHSQGSPKIAEPTVTEISPATNPTSMTIVGCVDQSGWQFFYTDGKPAEMNLPGQSAPQGASAVNASAAKDAAGWKVTEMTIAGVCAS